ncbi:MULTISPECIES: acyl-CoA carboxylase subunit beta [Xanthobacter]|uniref:Carboxyl transferase domain-containing protein n=1 Tax=Xanthobacter aminoxidans TaxID=186280 RepID=A0ABW6ZCK0_9HYPH|nr:carboxyl transferase domain-containing protein [Xanthobacter sp. 91]
MDEDTLKELESRRTSARAMGGAAALAKLKAAGKLDARERIERLLDPGSFREIGLLARSQHGALKARTPADGLVAGWGTIDGREVYVASEDASVIAGTRGRVAEAKSQRVRDLALRHRRPFIALMEAGAGRFQENNGAIAAGLGARFKEHFMLSGRVPQVAAVMGACFGGPSFTALQSDFVTIVAGSGYMGMSGPPVVKVGIGKVVSAEDIGGAEKSAAITGQADMLTRSDVEALAAIRAFLSFLPSNCDELPPTVAPRPAACDTPEGALRLTQIVSDNHRRAYDMEELIRLIVDGGELLHYRQTYGPSLITAFARMDGQSVGILANNPMKMAGAIDEKGIQKARKFVDTCNAFHIPLVFFVDCPGFMVGPEIENQRMVSLASRFLNSVIGASVPKATIVLRKAVGLAYLAMGGRVMAPDAIVAWPTAQFDVMGPAAGVELTYGKEIAKAADPAARRRELLASAEAQASAYLAAEMALIDDVIAPAETRAVILDVLARTRPGREPSFKHRIDP